MSALTLGAALAEVNERLAQDGRPPITARRLRAIAKRRAEEFGFVHFGGAWMFDAADIDHLMPGKPGRPKKEKEIAVD